MITFSTVRSIKFCISLLIVTSTFELKSRLVKVFWFHHKSSSLLLFKLYLVSGSFLSGAFRFHTLSGTDNTRTYNFCYNLKQGRTGIKRPLRRIKRPLRHSIQKNPKGPRNSLKGPFLDILYGRMNVEAPATSYGYYGPWVEGKRALWVLKLLCGTECNEVQILLWFEWFLEVIRWFSLLVFSIMWFLLY
jgi:hypothetical protein